jgi:uncharacterized protein (DUF342 family)
MAENESKNVTLSISADGYEAYLSVKPDSSTMQMTISDLGSILDKHGIVYGIKKEVLMVITARLQQGVTIDRVLVAEGIRPFEGTTPLVEYKFEFSCKPKEMASGKLDYREIATILYVSENDLLVSKRKLKPPRTGITVTGVRKSFPPIQDIQVWVGDNINKEETEDEIFYKAACDGALRYVNQLLSVFPTLDIADDVDFNVGNIHFKGDIKIGRDVLPDFIVEVSGNMKIWGSAIACQLKAGGNIDVRAGIVGKNKGTVHADGNLSATFVENATLTAKGNISVINGIIGSNVYCDGTLNVTMKRSRIVGSTIRAAGGISLYNAGSRFDTGTKLITGIYPEKEQNYLKIKKTLDARWNEAKELEKRYGRSTLENKSFPQSISDNVKRDIDKWEFLKKQIKTIIQHLKNAEEEMYNHEVIIKIKETLFPRVELQIGKYKFTASQEYYNVTAYYSDEAGNIVIK